MILDFGCGDGRRWRESCSEAVGIDVNLARLRIARSYLSVVRCDGRYLPFQDSIFSTIIVDSVLEHVGEHQRALAEVIRVLVSGGICRIFQPVDNDPVFIVARRLAKKWQGDPIVSYFTSNQLLKQLPPILVVTDVIYAPNAPITGAFSFFNRGTPRMLQGIDKMYAVASNATHLFHWQVNIVARKNETS